MSTHDEADPHCRSVVDPEWGRLGCACAPSPSYIGSHAVRLLHAGGEMFLTLAYSWRRSVTHLKVVVTADITSASPYASTYH